MKSRLLTASMVSVAVVLSSPFMGQFRAALRAAFPGRFVTIVAAALAAAIAGALIAAVIRIKERRAARYAVIALALIVGAGYSVISRTGVPDVDAVERVHFVEYGLIAFLFYRVWRPAGDVSSFALPILAGVIVGTLDEWLQWFIPVRVGEAKDVLLNLVSISCGLLFGAAIAPPPAFTPRLRGPSRRHVAYAAAAVVLLFGAFVQAVHLGHLVRDDRFGAFRSHYTLDELRTLSAERVQRWRADPPVVLKRLSREDQYMDEGLWHIRRRNETWAAGDYGSAWRENLILETLFAPVLDTRSYATPEPSRWPPSQRQDAAQRGASVSTPFVSQAEPYPLLIWPASIFWPAIALASLALIVAALRKS